MSPPLRIQLLPARAILQALPCRREIGVRARCGDPHRTTLLLPLLTGLALAGCSGDGGPAPTPTQLLTVRSATAGAAIDPNGYVVEIDDGAPSGALPANGSASFELDEGAHSVRLADVEPNCSVQGENPRVVTLRDTPGTTEFAVRCLRSIEIRDGTPSDNVAPWGGELDERYQQIYGSSALGAGGNITQLRFLSLSGPSAAPLAAGRYQIRLHTTTRPIDGLSHDLDTNLGPGSVVVLDAYLETRAYGDTLTFELDTPYFYDPAEGNLLLDVQLSGRVDDGLPARTFAAMANSALVSRRPAYGGVGDNYGLVTIFILDCCS